MISKLIADLTLSGRVERDVPAFLEYHRRPKTAEHVAEVAAEAKRVAMRVDADSSKAETAGWLHDVSAIFPGDQRVKVARQFGVAILPEEEKYPPIVHQKLSVVLAREAFNINDPETLSAIGCHTTLKRDASLLDKVVFVADKITWDQEGSPPYLNDILLGLEKSLDHAALVYLRYIWDQRDTLKVLHPWTREAYLQLSAQLEGD